MNSGASVRMAALPSGCTIGIALRWDSTPGHDAGSTLPGLPSFSSTFPWKRVSKSWRSQRLKNSSTSPAFAWISAKLSAVSPPKGRISEVLAPSGSSPAFSHARYSGIAARKSLNWDRVKPWVPSRSVDPPVAFTPSSMKARSAAVSSLILLKQEL